MKITETKNKGNVGISLWNQEWLDEITKLSGELAESNEYQVHMWALVIRKIHNDDSILDICIPLVIYNYKQEVYPASIDFVGDSVREISEATEELANIKARELIASLPESLIKGSELLIAPFNSLHRHP